MRLYKEKLPTETISLIRSILFSIGMLPIEHSWYNPKPGIFSVRVENPTEKGHFGTNGKGRNVYFALASAYAEFIERIQNGFIVGANGLNRLFLKELKSSFGFYYYPDERILSKEEFLRLPQKYLLDLFGNADESDLNRFLSQYFQRLHENGLEGVVSVPFYDIENKQVVYFPYNLTLVLSGSNGMAAGNSINEAFFQALCELVERYSARTVYFDRLTPPTISDSYLSLYPQEFSIIQNLRDVGYDVLVKDFSCGIRLPAVGVLLIDPQKKKYRLNIGSETSFKNALSRALTEIFQGIGDDDVMKSIMLDIPQKEHEFFSSDTEEAYQQRETQIRQFIVDGTGVFPYALFLNQPSYAFDPGVFSPKESYAEEVKGLLSLFSSLGHSVYVRDVSYLGFPSLHVYIPEVSVWGRKTKQNRPTINSIIRGIEHDKLEDVFFPTDSLLNDSIRLLNILDLLAPHREVFYSGISMARLLKLEFTNDCAWNLIPVNFFITLLCFINEEYSNARKFLIAFLEETDGSDNEYYKKVLQLFTDLENGKPFESLLGDYSFDFLEGFSSRTNLFKHIPFPTCPSCSHCPLSEKCLTKYNFANALSIARSMKNTIIDQSISFKQ